MKLALAILFTAGVVPAFYFGALLAQRFEFFPLLVVPSVMCLVIAGEMLARYEQEVAGD